MTRKELYDIYIKLTDKEKVQWAKILNYASVQGLYKYLQLFQDRKSDTRFIQALVKVVNSERLKSLSDKVIDIKEEYKKALINEIFSCNNREEILKIREDIVNAADNQINKIDMIKSL